MNRRSREFVARALLLVVTSLVTSVALDRAMGVVARAGSAVQIAHPPNFKEHRKTVEFSYEFRTNSMGLRYRDIPLNKPSDAEVRAVVVGDSYVEGWGVADDERFTSLLEKSFSSPGRPASFVNAGLTGVGPLQYARVLFAVGMQYHPDLALIVIHANDVDDTPADAHLDLEERGGRFEVRSAAPAQWQPGSIARRLIAGIWPWAYGRLQAWSAGRDERYLKSLGFWERTHERARRLGISEAAFQEWKVRVPEHLWQAVARNEFSGYVLVPGLFAPNYLADSLDVETKDAQAKWSAMQQILSDTVALCRKTAITCAVVYAPAAFQYDPSAGQALKAVGIRLRPEWLEGQSRLEARLEKWAADEAVPYHSLTNDFRSAAVSAPPGFYNFEFDGHWNAHGHRLAADALKQWLELHRLIPPPSPK
jgi:lysophospholipase L1-like esterase